MATITTLSESEIAQFTAFSSITSATVSSGNVTQLVETWGAITKTTDLTYSSGSIATVTVVWARA